MSKPADAKKEKTGEIKAPAKAPAGPPAPVMSGGGGGKGAVGTKVGCHATGCKEKDMRLTFCDEHFKQFKFGLITKKGDKVLDYEKKFEHYQKWLKAQKVA